MMYAALLRSIDDVYFLVFLFYIAFATVGLLNVITGIFVDSAVCTRTDDEVVDAFKQDTKRLVDEAQRMFDMADNDEDGQVTYDELERCLAEPWVKAYFFALDMDPSEARSMFTIMDTNNDGKVEVDEFIGGCMKLK